MYRLDLEKGPGPKDIPRYPYFRAKIRIPGFPIRELRQDSSENWHPPLGPPSSASCTAKNTSHNNIALARGSTCGRVQLQGTMRVATAVSLLVALLGASSIEGRTVARTTGKYFPTQQQQHQHLSQLQRLSQVSPWYWYWCWRRPLNGDPCAVPASDAASKCPRVIA